MKCRASWQGNDTIRVTLTLAPGELHPKVSNPVEVEAWLRTLLEPHGDKQQKQAAKP